jgi:hypothetical protein
MTAITVTHLISTDQVQTAKHGIMVRFALPNESLQKKPFIQASSSSDVERQQIFLVRNYIVEKLSSWLRQRSHAVPAYAATAASLLNWLEQYQKTNLTNIVSFVNRHQNAFYSLAPTDRSKCYNHFQSTIVQIIDYCKENQSA